MTPPSTFKELLSRILDIVDIAIPVLISVVVVYYIWRLVDAWVINGGDESKVEEGKKVAVIGIVVLVIILTVWSILAFLNNSIFG